jgi:hypothetical protein
MDLEEDSQPGPVTRSPGEGDRVCPYLGIYKDLEVRYSFPETLNCCHKVNRPQRVDLDHQREVCLAGPSAYQACPVFSARWKGPLPRALRGIQHTRRTRSYGLLIGGLALLALAAGFVFVLRPAWLTGDATPVPLAVAELTRSATPLPAASDTPEIEFTPTLPEPTLTATPEVTFTATQTATLGTPTPGPLENTPFGLKDRFVVHVVKEGELMEAIAKTYSTSPIVLKVLNGLKPEAGFWPGVPVVVAVGEADPNNVFAMQAVWLAQPVMVDVLAAKYTTPADELRSLNGLGPADTVPGGRWIVARKKLPKP